MKTTTKRFTKLYYLFASLLIVSEFGQSVWAQQEEKLKPQTAREKLSPFMNSVPPSKDFFCVSNGASNLALHPDRAPYTRLAEQNGVVLFSGTAPQLGLNFTLTAGALEYSNQMNTLGSPEPPPQLGTAGMMTLQPWNSSYPWSEARWHPGEDISWEGHRDSLDWLYGLPHFEYIANCSINGTCSCLGTCNPAAEIGPLVGGVWEPSITELFVGESTQIGWGLNASFNLQLSRGIYQLSQIRMHPSQNHGSIVPHHFREPWFQGEGDDPAFSVGLTPPLPYDQTNALGEVRIDEKIFPNFHNVYTYRKLKLDGGRLEVDFERSATWPRETAEVTTNALNVPTGAAGGGKSGTMLAEVVKDEYGNRIEFDRVPKYGWETDFKMPRSGTYHGNPTDQTKPFPLPSLPALYYPLPNAWRLPHKKLRTVKVYEADQLEPLWTVAFIYEHPDSDRISNLDAPDDFEQWKSIYSHLPQGTFDRQITPEISNGMGRLPRLNDETTLLTVQAYKQANMTDGTSNFKINGADYQDDYYVWGSTIGAETAQTKGRVNHLDPLDPSCTNPKFFDPLGD